jgi:hypothetical protein
VYFCGRCTPPKEISFLKAIGADRDRDPANDELMVAAFFWAVHATGLVCALLLIAESCFGWRWRASPPRQQLYVTLITGVICCGIIYNFVSRHSRMQAVAPAGKPVLSKSASP